MKKEKFSIDGFGLHTISLNCLPQNAHITLVGNKDDIRMFINHVKFINDLKLLCWELSGKLLSEMKKKKTVLEDKSLV
jgi:hypothetical protein